MWTGLVKIDMSKFLDSFGREKNLIAELHMPDSPICVFEREKCIIQWNKYVNYYYNIMIIMLHFIHKVLYL